MHTFYCILSLRCAYSVILYYRCVDVTGAYSAQKTELNISLTAIGLLWTMTDFIAKGLLGGPSEEKETGSYVVNLSADEFLLF